MDCIIRETRVGYKKCSQKKITSQRQGGTVTCDRTPRDSRLPSSPVATRRDDVSIQQHRCYRIALNFIVCVSYSIEPCKRDAIAGSTVVRGGARQRHTTDDRLQKHFETLQIIKPVLLLSAVSRIITFGEEGMVWEGLAVENSAGLIPLQM